MTESEPQKDPTAGAGKPSPDASTPPSGTPPEQEPKKGSPRKIRRVQIGVNVAIQIVILLFIVLMVNYLGFRHYERWDFSRNQKYTLSEKSLQILGAMDEPVDVIVWFDENTTIYGDLTSLLTEYQIRSKGKLRLEYVDPLRNPARTRELVAKYRFRENENVVILDNGRNSKFVYGADMVEYEPIDPIMAQVQKKPDIRSFSGEQRITSALQEVISTDKPKVYFTQGHGEPAFEEEEEKPSPIALIKDYLTKENLELAQLTLIMEEEIPKDADALVIVSPRYDFNKRELAMMNDYWERGGRVLLFLDPNAKTRNLVEFCAQNGVVPRSDRVLRTQEIQSGVHFVLVDKVPATFTEESVITDPLAQTSTSLNGGTQSLELDERVARQKELTIARLLLAGEGYWGETEYPVPPEGTVQLDKGLDAEAPLVLAASVEQVAGEMIRRMVVVGNGAIVEDKTMGSSQNLQLIISSLNWALDRQELLGIVPKARNDFRLDLSEKQKTQIKVMCIFVVPLIAAIVGLLVWLKRRK